MAKYCKILNCLNNNYDPNKKNVLYFRLPSDENQRRHWIDSIRTHQHIDNEPNSLFYVCDMHFDQSKINRNAARNKLAKNAVPDIFPER